MVDKARKSLLVVTGVSGAGKSEVLRCLEDMGYDCVDNMPLRLVPALLQDLDDLPDKMVLAVDARNADFETHQREALEAIRAVESHILYLNASEEKLVLRYKETRRAHPLSADKMVRHALRDESEALTDLRENADTILDTTDFKPKQLWQYIREHFVAPAASSLQVYLMSFGFKHGVPREADYVFDVRSLRNPYWDKDLKEKTGLEMEVQDYVRADKMFDTLMHDIHQLLIHQLDVFKKADRASVTVAVGCTGGKHRSVTVAAELYNQLREAYAAHIYHRDVI